MNISQLKEKEHGEIAARVPVWLFFISLGIGTVLLIGGVLFPGIDLLFMIGFFYTLTAVTINAIAFVALMFLSFVYTCHANQIRINTMLLLVNIPIAILYIYILFSGIFNINPNI